MERLINSSSISSSKLHNDIPKLARINSHKLGGFTESRRVNLAFPLKADRFRSGSSCFSKKIEPFLVNSHLGPSMSCGFEPEPSSELQASSDVSCKLQKVIAVGKLFLLSALAMIVVNPALPLPAFASFQTTTTTAGRAVGQGLFRIELLSSAWTGFLAGCLHTLSGPDHLAALAPLSIGRSRIESAAVGALWGCGHDAGQLIFGLLFLILKDRLHIEIIRTWGTRVVGLTLLVIGAMGIKEALEIPAPIIATENGDLQAPLVGKKKIGFATFATGVVHGLQPDALLIILPALALPSRLAGAAFLGMFLVGTVVAMGGFTVFIGSCSEALKERVPKITEKLTWASSLVAIGLGLAIIMSQFLGFSLY